MPTFTRVIESLIAPKEVASRTQHYDIDLLAIQLADVLRAMDQNAIVRHKELLEQIEFNQKANYENFDHFNALLECLIIKH